MKKGKNLYLLVSLCMMAASSIGLYLNSFGVFFSPRAEVLGEKRGNVARFNTIMIFANAVFSIIVPMVATNKNYKKFYLGGIIGSIAALILMANATGLLMLYAGGLLLGASASTYFLVVITTVINNSFEGNAGTMGGIVFSCSGLAGAIFSPMFASIISASGYKTAFYVMAVLAAVLCAPALFADIKIEKEGLEKESGNTGKLNMLSMAFILCTLMMVFYQFLPSLPQHFPGIGISKGLSESVAPLLVSAAMVGNIVFKLIAGVMIDKLGALRTLLAMTGLNIIGSVLLFIGNNALVSMAGAFLFGAMYSITSFGGSSVVRDVFGDAAYKRAYSVISFFGCASNALGISLVGYIYDFTSSYDPAIIMSVVLAILAYLSATAAKKKHS